MNITINKKDYKVKYTIRALFIFEQITGKSFEIKTLLDHYVFFYSMILANNEDNVISWDDFIDAVDNDKTLIEQLNKIITEYQTKDNLFDDSDKENNDSKKKLSLSELYAILTLQLHLSPEYVMDRMEFYEIRALMKYQYYAHKDNWEQARLISYLIAQVNSKKQLKLSDIIEFEWDKENIELNKSVSNEEIAKLREQAKLVALQLQNNLG